MKIHPELEAYIARIVASGNTDTFTPQSAMQVGIYLKLEELTEEIRGLRADLNEPEEEVPVTVTDALDGGEETPAPGPPEGTSSGSLAGPAGEAASVVVTKTEDAEEPHE